MSAGPLHGLVVIDLTRVLAGPFCTMLLADLGAEVIKIERPDGGDDSRAFGPFIKGESAYFMSINRGKKSATLNLKHPHGKELLKKLASQADILVENFKPGVMDRLGLGYSILSALNPRLIYAAVSGFGQTGPYSDRPAYDLVIQGMGGLMSITGPDEKHPTKVGSSVADIFAGVFATIGILAAIYSREKTGRGQMVDVGMLDCMVAILENAVARYVATGTNPRPIGNRHPSIAPFATFTTADGAINLAIGNDELWKKFCSLSGVPNLAEDQRFATNPLRVQNWSDLEVEMNKILASRTTSFWLDILQQNGIPCGPINSISDVLADAHVISRKMLVEVMHPIAGSIKIPGVPIKLSETPAEITDPAPTLGQHNVEIWGKKFGYSKEDLDALHAKGII